MKSNIILNYSGKISRTVKKNSVFVCEAFGTRFYMEAGELYHPAHCDAFVPAWLVHLSSSPTMTVRAHEVPFKFNYTAGVRDVALSVKVTIYQLLPATAYIDENDVVLTRPTFDGMTEKMIKPKAKPKAKASTRAARMRSSEQSEDNKAARHLLK